MQQQQQQQTPFQQPKIIEPPEYIKEIIKQTIKIIREQGFEKEEQLKQEHVNDPNYQFLFFPTQYFWYFQEMKRELLQELMQQTQQKILYQSGGPIPIPPNQVIPHGIQMHHPPPPHSSLLPPPPPGMIPMQMPPPPQGIIQGHPHLPPPHIQHLQFMGQNAQFQPQQQNIQGKQMLPPQPNIQMIPPIQNQNQPGPPLMPPPPMFNPQFMNQFQPLNNQQGQSMQPHPPPMPPPMQPPINIRQLSPNTQPQIPGFIPQMQPQYLDYIQQQQQSQLLNQQPNAFSNNLVFNPSQQQLQQQHEMHVLKMKKEESNKKRTRWGDQVQMIHNLTPQQLNQQHFIMPGTTQSGGNANQRTIATITSNLSIGIVFNSKNPEMLSGSLMVELVKQNNKKIAEQTGKFKKYQPIDPQNNKDQSSLKSKLNSLLDYADDVREQELKSMEKKKKERERELELKRMEEQGIDTYELRNPEKKGSTKRNIEKEVEELYGVQKVGEQMNIEMGIRSDGRVAGPQVHGFQGFGGGSGGAERNQDSVFSAFRMARSKNYHATAEERSQFRDKGSDLCYKCSRPGHIARECKYGMS